jgi:purine-nucleoside phosphorylase
MGLLIRYGSESSGLGGTVGHATEAGSARPLTSVRQDGPMTTHVAAAPGDVAEAVLLPGDPLRARWIAETFLDDVQQYSAVRNMLGFTGTWRGQPVSVQGSGMGQPSLAIYVHELLTELGVRTVVRVGYCGALRPEVRVHDLVLAMSAATDSSMNRHRFEGVDFAPTADFALLRRAVTLAEDAGLAHHVGPIASWDSFYNDRPELLTRLADYGVLAVEMETAALYTLAARHGARALTVCTVSDSIVTGEATTADERERGFHAMARLALDLVAVPPSSP